MANIITRELLEHFLRAAGWQVGKDLRKGGRIISIENAGVDLELVAYAESLKEVDLAAHLGLCAAAEFLLSEADGYEVSATDSDGPRESLTLSAVKLLRQAGIDLDRWEATR